MILGVAIVGCGKIADQHIAAIRRISGCRVTALCDQEILMAKQLGERFGITETFSDLEDMLRATSPDVVHITTPPQSHFRIACECLQKGSHVYLEKPFTVTSAEAEKLIEMAGKAGLRLAAGHNLQFTAEMIEMRRLLDEGFLGGKPVHLESYFSYDLSDSSYAAPVLGSQNHWVRRLPGKLLHNVISHGIARLVPFIDDVVPDLTVCASRSDELQKLGEIEIVDEMRLMLRDEGGTTAFFAFSTQFRPGVNQLRIYGRRNSVVVDHGSGTLIREEDRSDKSYLTYVAPPVRLGMQHLHSAWKNLVDVVRGRLHQDAGMKNLIESFYESIRRKGNPPIPYREILLTARLMDRTFEQIYSEKIRTPADLPLEASR